MRSLSPQGTDVYTNKVFVVTCLIQRFGNIILILGIVAYYNTVKAGISHYVFNGICIYITCAYVTYNTFSAVEKNSCGFIFNVNFYTKSVPEIFHKACRFFSVGKQSAIF